MTWDEVSELIENGMENGLLAHRGLTIGEKYDEALIE